VYAAQAGHAGLASAVGPYRDLGGEQFQERIHVTAEQRRQEPLGDLPAHLRIGGEPRPPGLDVFARPVRQLAYRRRRALHDPGDLGVWIAEHVAEHEHRALKRCQRLQHDHHRERHRLGRLLRLGGGLDERLGQPRPEYVS